MTDLYDVLAVVVEKFPDREFAVQEKVLGWRDDGKPVTIIHIQGDASDENDWTRLVDVTAAAIRIAERDIRVVLDSGMMEFE